MALLRIRKPNGEIVEIASLPGKKGEVGPQGEKGDKGDKGDAGKDGKDGVGVGEATKNGGEIFNLYEDTTTNLGTIGGISIGKQTLPKNAATGDYAHAQGISTVAGGKGSHAQGVGTQALGEASHAQGAGVLVTGAGSHGEGRGVNFEVTVTAVNGNKVTVKSNNPSVLLGPSELESIKRNAVIWYKTNSDTDAGEFYYVKSVELVKNILQIVSENKLTLDRTPSFTSTGITLKVIMGSALSFISHTEGNYCNALDISATSLYGVGDSDNQRQHVEGSRNLVLGYAGHGEGEYTLVIGNMAHAQGAETIAEGIMSHAGGRNTHAKGACSFAGGRNSVAEGADSFTHGFNTTAKGYASTAFGGTANAYGEYSFAGGQGAFASASHSFAYGKATSATNECQAVFGRFNGFRDSALFIVGNGSAEGARKNAFVVEEDGSAEIQTQGTKANSVVTKAYVDALIARIEALEKTLNDR